MRPTSWPSWMSAITCSPGMKVVDLGAAPGGWSQYARRRVGPDGRVIALDMLPMEAIPGVEFILGDFTEQPVLALAGGSARRAGGRSCNLGHGPQYFRSDRFRPGTQLSIWLNLALDFADKHLKPGGGFLVKTFQGEGFSQLFRAMQGRFDKVVSRKPKASRAESREIYLLRQGLQRQWLSPGATHRTIVSLYIVSAKADRNEDTLNNLTKNLLLWLVIAIVLMSVFNNFGQRQQASARHRILAVHPACAQRPGREGDCSRAAPSTARPRRARTSPPTARRPTTGR